LRIKIYAITSGASSLAKGGLSWNSSFDNAFQNQTSNKIFYKCPKTQSNFTSSLAQIAIQIAVLVEFNRYGFFGLIPVFFIFHCR